MHTWKLLVGIAACIFLTVNAGGCSSTPVGTTQSDDNILITTDEFEGVIFHDRDWVPTVEEVRTLEKQLIPICPGGEMLSMVQRYLSKKGYPRTSVSIGEFLRMKSE